MAETAKKNEQYNLLEAEQDFLELMRQDGLIYNGHLIQDGKIHRFPGIGKHKNNQDAWYVFHGDWGAFGDWSSGINEGWIGKRKNLSPQEKKELHQKITDAKKAANEEREKNYEEEAVRAQTEWGYLTSFGDSEYLRKKNIQQTENLGIRFGKDEKGSFIAVPMLDMKGKLWSFEKIYDNGFKKSFPGGKKKGNFHTLGTIKDTSPLYIAEGFSTGVSVHLATSETVLIAFGIQNIGAVIEAVTPLFTSVGMKIYDKIIIAGDANSKTETEKIAKTYGVSAVFPQFNLDILEGIGFKERKDWNDLHRLEGLEEVKRQFLEVSKSEVPYSVALAKNSESPKQPIATSHSKAITYTRQELLELKFHPRKMLLCPIISEKSINMLYAPRGIGKTYLSLEIAHAVASGSNMFQDRWKAESNSSVLYVDGEMPIDKFQERIRMIGDHSKRYDPLHFYNNDTQENSIPDLSTKKGQGNIEELIVRHKTKLIILDNISSLFRSGSENESGSWDGVQEWLLNVRKSGTSVLLIHHAGKGGNQRGTSKREDVLDTVIALKKSSDYEPEQGARFEVHFEKTRGFCGKDALPFVVHMSVTNSCADYSLGKVEWSVMSLEASLLERVVALSKEGLKQHEIAIELGMGKEKQYEISRKLKKAKEIGLIP